MKNNIMICFTIFLILAGASIGSASYKYDINMDITCVEPVYHPETGVYLGCTKHRQSGSLERDTECFPGDIMVATPRGYVRMDTMKIGDKVFGWDNGPVETEIVFWFHRITNQEFDFNLISTNNGSMAVSGLHNVAYRQESFFGDVWYKYSDHFNTSDLLIGTSSDDAVIGIKNIKRTGLYAPHTTTGNLFIGYNTTYLAHTFANVKMPTIYKAALDKLVNIVSYWNPDVNKLTNETNYIHPIANYLLGSKPAKIVIDEYRERRSSSDSSSSDDSGEEEQELEIIMTFTTGLNMVSIFNPPVYQNRSA